MNRQDQILQCLAFEGGRLFEDGFNYSLMRPWSGSRTLVTARMVKRLRRHGLIDRACRLTEAGRDGLKS